MINKWFSPILGATLLLLASSEAFAQAAPIPEPESLALLGIGAAAILASRRKRK